MQFAQRSGAGVGIRIFIPRVVRQPRMVSKLKYCSDI
jgi:hypothetical protein